MLGKTSLSAIRTLIHLAQSEAGACVSPRRIAEALGESPTYLAKVCRLLVRAGILRAEKGVRGGVWLSRPPAQVTLLSIIEACQGTMVGDYCLSGRELSNVCSFHRAALELHEAITGVLTQWTLAQLLEKPRPVGELPADVSCVLVNRQALPEQPPVGNERRLSSKGGPA
jgi:Rrf2 family protein